MEAASRGDTNGFGAALKISSRRFKFWRVPGMPNDRYSPVTIPLIARCGRRRQHRKNKQNDYTGGADTGTWAHVVCGCRRTSDDSLEWAGGQSNAYLWEEDKNNIE